VVERNTSRRIVMSNALGKALRAGNNGEAIEVARANARSAFADEKSTYDPKALDRAVKGVVKRMLQNPEKTPTSWLVELRVADADAPAAGSSPTPVPSDKDQA
jgi:hypothetical protein